MCLDIRVHVLNKGILRMYVAFPSTFIADLTFMSGLIVPESRSLNFLNSFLNVCVRIQRTIKHFIMIWNPLWSLTILMTYLCQYIAKLIQLFNNIKLQGVKHIYLIVYSCHILIVIVYDISHNDTYIQAYVFVCKLTLIHSFENVPFYIWIHYCTVNHSSLL